MHVSSFPTRTSNNSLYFNRGFGRAKIQVDQRAPWIRPTFQFIWASPSTSVQDKTHLFFHSSNFTTSTFCSKFSTTLCRWILLLPEPWVREAHARCLLLGYPEYRIRRWHVNILPVPDWDQKQWLIVPTHYPFHLACLAGSGNSSPTFLHLV